MCYTETLKDAALFQRAKIEVVKETDGDARAQILMQLLTLANTPYTAQGHEHQLATTHQLHAHPPTLQFEQVSIIIVDDQTLLTVRAEANPGLCCKLWEYCAARGVGVTIGCAAQMLRGNRTCLAARSSSTPS